VGIQEVRWEMGCTEQTEDLHFSMDGNGDHQLGTGFFCIRELYQWLGEGSLLVIGYCI
jgi:hypothetical protein